MQEGTAGTDSGGTIQNQSTARRYDKTEAMGRALTNITNILAVFDDKSFNNFFNYLLLCLPNGT